MPSTLGIVASGEDVLNDAVFWIDAARSTVAGGTLSNLGKGGSALNAQFGSTTGSDTNDPTLLAHTGTNYLYLPGVGANTANIPDSAALDITGDIEIEWVGELDWSIAGDNGALISKEAASQRSYTIRRTSGALTLQFVWTTNGTTALIRTSTTNVPLDTNAIKVTLDVDNGAAGHDVAFYTSNNFGQSYTQLGTTVTTAGTTSIHAGTAQVQVYSGSVVGQVTTPGKIYRVVIRNGIGGTVALDADFRTGITSGEQTTFTESSANAATVTIARSTTGRKAVAVTRPVLLFGTDDMLEVADSDLLDFGASDSFTVLVVHRQWNTFGTNDALIAKKANTTNTTQGWMLGSGSTTAAQGQSQIGDGTAGVTAVSASRTAGSLTVSALVRSVAADTVTTYLNATAGTPATDTTTGSLANAEVMRIGRLSGAGTEYSDMEVLAAAVWRRALTANEIATIVARYA